MSADVRTLTRLVNSEVIEAMGLPVDSWTATRLQRRPRDHQRLALMIQIMHQMMGKRLKIEPHVSFGPAISPHDESRSACNLQTIVNSAEHLLESHLAWQI